MIEKKNGEECCEIFKNIPTPDSANRLALPTSEWKIFLEKNGIKFLRKQKLILVPTETAKSFWGMTFAQFEKLIQAICERDRFFIDSIYRAHHVFKVNENRKTSPFTFLEKSGLLSFSKNERLQIACSLHEDFEGAGYFLKFMPIVLQKIGEKNLPIVLSIRDRIERIFGTEFSDFLAKMRR
jgi:hypothetical protein